MRPLIYLAILLAASACQCPVITDAPAIPFYSESEEQRAKQDYDALPADSPLRQMLRDCRYLRDEIRVAH